MIKHFNGYLFIFLSILYFFGCNTEHAPPLSPADEQNSFELASGLKIELVACEPMVQQPVAMIFDEDGRLWVVEMRGFMPDIDGVGEERPSGRVSVLLDIDHDGEMDSSVVFADSLVLPRAIALVKGGVLIAESIPLWFFEDLDGDLKADRKTLVDSLYGGKAIVEHSPNGLWRGLDGWYYNVKSDNRYRLNGIQWEKETTEFRGQWGLSHDDVGRLFYNYNWSQLHADLVPPNYLNRNPHHTATAGIDHGLTLDRRVFPIRSNLAANRGNVPGTLDSLGQLQEFTSACSPLVYRGDALPDFYGDVFVCEPVGNLIKRNIIDEQDYLLSARNAYEGKEFLAATDERFRPVALANGPNGALYIADMYHGIIQHGIYMTEYLRNTTLQRGLDKHIHLGRIWRIVPESFTEPTLEKLSELSSDDLVNHLKSKNGWTRDMAQQCLTERQDVSIIPPLIKLTEDTTSAYQTRIHALWTLDGLSQKDSKTYFNALHDPNDQVKILAIRLLEKLAHTDPNLGELIEKQLIALSAKTSVTVNLQLALSAGSLDKRGSFALLRNIATTYYQLPLMRDAIISSLTDQELSFFQELMKDDSWKTGDSNRLIFIELLAAAVAQKGDPSEIAFMINLIGSSGTDLGWKEMALLNGLSNQAGDQEAPFIQLKEQPGLILDRAKYSQEIQMKIGRLSDLLTWPGKKIDVKVTQEVTVDPLQYAQGRQQYLNVCSGCHGNDGRGMNRFAPPLRNSEWVLGDERRLVLILIHGMQGAVEVGGKVYSSPDILPEMPSFSVFDDQKLAAIMTYIRNEWGHQSASVKGSTVGYLRIRNQGKLKPWTSEELLQLEEEEQVQ